MRVAAISDTHGRRDWSVPRCDVFVHAGDLTGDGSLWETALFAKRLEKEMDSPDGPQHAIIVPGNHDECFEHFLEPALTLFGPKVHVLLDQSFVLDGVCFYGSPWTPPFMQWSFMAGENQLASLYENMPPAVDVLVTHGPPRGILDPGWKTPHAGSSSLARAVKKRRVRHHVFGHLHAAGGHMMRQGETIFYNVAACDEQHRIVNQARVFEVEAAP